MTETKNVNALLPVPQYERLREAAYESRRSMTDILREALEDWLKHHDATNESVRPPIPNRARH